MAKRAPDDIVLTTPDLVQFICAFQDGIPTDFVAFQHIYVGQYSTKSANEVDPVMVSWLETHGLGRIPLLVDNVPIAKYIVMYFAADHGRVDILEIMHDHLGSTEMLFELSAAKGHLAALEYLHRIGYKRRLEFAARVALEGGHVAILKFLLETYVDVDGFNEWLTDDYAKYAILNHQSEALDFLLNVWFPVTNPSMATTALPKLLSRAAWLGEIERARWCAAQLQSSDPNAILSAYVTRDKMDSLWEFIDMDMDVNVETTDIVYASSIDKLTIVFNQLACLKEGASKRREIATKSLVQATRNCNWMLMRWLVEGLPMHPTDAQRVLTSGTCGEGSVGYDSLGDCEDSGMATFFETHHITFHRPFMLSILAIQFERAKHIDWQAMKRTNVDSFATYCVAKFIQVLAQDEGSDVTVMGRVIQYMLTITFKPPGVAALRKIYKVWESIIQDDEAQSMKRKIEGEMLAEATEQRQTKWVKWLVKETTAGDIQKENNAGRSKRTRRR
ncbi:Aste57867_19225 [Aphanomyces stellatus]|uniref:Aste57867_15742 protein n=1 Tax=Aphanomyces stellatus TaxID=120398 RepID=A0A485L552_9STRA|nr:hypothetical protein As57867_019161 [Aphanomyces stellatus]KAF0693265.1 hypothetical protein As57867_015686 [Aphanomyces stellatus]VFT92531.1 Aste57867_15742 [Aphanomyces stellatus]VFT95946.1 Aste57867_19225 [Aphanomyces stellatus]